MIAVDWPRYAAIVSIPSYLQREGAAQPFQSAGAFTFAVSLALFETDTTARLTVDPTRIDSICSPTPVSQFC